MLKFRQLEVSRRQCLQFLTVRAASMATALLKKIAFGEVQVTAHINSKIQTTADRSIASLSLLSLQIRLHAVRSLRLISAVRPSCHTTTIASSRRSSLPLPTAVHHGAHASCHQGVRQTIATQFKAQSARRNVISPLSIRAPGSTYIAGASWKNWNFLVGIAV